MTGKYYYKDDVCDAKGARKLEARIASYWAERGFPPPQITLVDVGFVPSMRTARVDVRSTMKNGWPVSPSKTNAEGGKR